MLPNWFKVGAILYFRGTDPPYQVISFNESENTWIGSYYGDMALYSLEEVSKYWLPIKIDLSTKEKIAKYTKLISFL